MSMPAKTDEDMPADAGLQQYERAAMHCCAVRATLTFGRIPVKPREALVGLALSKGALSQLVNLLKSRLQLRVEGIYV